MVILKYRQIYNKQFYVLLTECISMIFTDLEINNDYFPLQNWQKSSFTTEGKSVYC